MKQAEAEAERESDIHVVTRAVYRGDNEGYYDFKRPQHIWVVPAPRSADEKVQPKQLTSGRFDEGGTLWSKDGAQIYFASLHNDEPYYERPKTELYSIPAGGGEATKLTTIDMDTGSFALSPDGKQIAFIASATQPVNSYTQPDLWVLDLVKDAKPRNLTAAFDWDVGASVFGDNGRPARRRRKHSALGAGREEHRREFREGRANESRLVRCRDRRDDGNHERKPSRRAVSARRQTPRRLVYFLSTPTKIGDLFWLDRVSGEARQLTHSNEELFGQLNLTEPEEIRYKSFDGKRSRPGCKSRRTSIRRRSIRSF